MCSILSSISFDCYLVVHHFGMAAKIGRFSRIIQRFSTVEGLLFTLSDML